jgi:hypothetical protein
LTEFHIQYLLLLISNRSFFFKIDLIKNRIMGLIYFIILIIVVILIFNRSNQSGLFPFVCFVPLGCSSQSFFLPFHRSFESKIRAAKKNRSSFFVFCIPSLHTFSQFVRKGYQIQNTPSFSYTPQATFLFI